MVWLVVKWVVGVLVVACVAGVVIVWKMDQANRIGGDDHDFGMFG